MGSVRSRWFPSVADEQLRMEEEQEVQRETNAVLIRWVQSSAFKDLVGYVEKEIVRCEPGPDTPNMIFNNGMVKGLRLVEQHLKNLSAKVQEIVDV